LLLLINEFFFDVFVNRSFINLLSLERSELLLREAREGVLSADDLSFLNTGLLLGDLLLFLLLSKNPVEETELSGLYLDHLLLARS